MNDVLEGEYNILKDTGFTIHSDTKKFDIHVGKIKVAGNTTATRAETKKSGSLDLYRSAIYVATYQHYLG